METASVGSLDVPLPIATEIDRRLRFQSQTSKPIDLFAIGHAAVILAP